MNHIKVISVDLFQTMVDVLSRKRDVWEQLLDKEFSLHLYEKGWVLMDLTITEYFTETAGKTQRFLTVREIFKGCCKKVFKIMELDLCPDRAAEILVHAHARSKPFKDTLPFLRVVGKKYPVCLSSDTDNAMLGKFALTYPFDRIFTSENLSAYKLSPKGKFFTCIKQHYPVSPMEILHIGDSAADILGASAAGITTCWINRKGAVWKNPTKPDFTVTSLLDIAELLSRSGKPGL